MRIEAKLPNNLVNNTSNGTAALARPGFAKALEQVQPANVKVIQAGDTLTSIVKEQALLQGVKLSASEEFRWAQNLAAWHKQAPKAAQPLPKTKLKRSRSQPTDLYRLCPKAITSTQWLTPYLAKPSTVL
jgi:hypothetical protein